MVTILVVEDSSVDRMLIGGLLAKEGVTGGGDWEIEFAVDGQEALERLDSKDSPEIDLVVTDLQMPRINGLELVKEIRRTRPELPVILITSQGSEEIAVEALRAGATSYSPKSLLRADLVRTIRQVLQMSAFMRYEHDTTVLPAPRQIAFVLENDSSLIGPTIEHLQENLPSWTSQDRWQFVMAMNEALVNAMHHGNLEVASKLRESENEEEYYDEIRNRKNLPPFCHRRVRVEAEFSDRHICVQISDDGSGFDPSRVGDPTEDVNLNKVSGRGLFLIRSFMDQVAHNLTGNQITMTKLRKDET
ncbi:MAG: response regulator [Planctomycetota bacterium]